jgi:hypothetical protein
MLPWLHVVLPKQPFALTSGRFRNHKTIELKRRTEEELEKRSWAKALANLNTVELGGMPRDV